MPNEGISAGVPWHLIGPAHRRRRLTWLGDQPPLLVVAVSWRRRWQNKPKPDNAGGRGADVIHDRRQVALMTARCLANTAIVVL